VVDRTRGPMVATIALASALLSVAAFVIARGRAPERAPLPTFARGAQLVVDMQDGQRVEGALVRQDADLLVLRGEHATFQIDARRVAKAEQKPETPTRPASAAGRLPSFQRCMEAFAEGRQETFRQIPATVVMIGPLARVPYVSHRAAALELNVYGDPDTPAGIEVGIVEGTPTDAARRECVALMASLLQPADAKALDGLSLVEGRVEKDGLVFEVTPATAEDAFHAWWLSIYVTELDRMRASDAELKEIATQRTPQDEDLFSWSAGELSQARPGDVAQGDLLVYVRGYHRRDGVYVGPTRR
jgi:hypothetical protein